MGTEEDKKAGKGREEDPLDDFLAEDEEGPTRSLGSIEGALGRPTGSPGPSIGSFVASEEAMRVFDEMSNPGEYSIPGGYSVRFGHQQERSVMEETLAPYPDKGQEGAGPYSEDPEPSMLEPPPLPTAPKLPRGMEHTPRVTFRDGWEVFQHCPCPLFRMDALGRLQSANLALGEFLGAPIEELVGLELHNTRLGSLYSALEADIQECLAGNTGLQRFLSFQDAEQRMVRFLLWIVPIPASPGRPVPFAGIILPFPSE